MYNQINQGIASVSSQKTDRRGQIDSQLSELEGAIDYLQKSLQELAEKIGPVIYTQAIENKKDPPECPVPTIALLADRIRKSVQRLSRMRSEVDQLCQSVEL